MKHPYIISHRGFSGILPENSIESIRGAEISGTDIIEMDLQLTSDGKVVLFHDRSFMRVLPELKEKSIHHLPYEEIKYFDYGSWFDEGYSDVRIPTLEKVLEVHNLDNMKSDFIFEMKSPYPEKLVPKVLNILDDFNFKISIGYISVRDEETFDIVKENDNQIPVALMQKRRSPEELMAVLKQYNIKITQIRPGSWTKDDWDMLMKSGLKFTIFYADTPKQFSFFVEKKPNGILTNFPTRLKTFYLQNL